MIEGKVAKINSNTEVVVNVGSADGVEYNSEYIIYEVGDVIEDPDTGEALGNVEHLKARVTPKHIQENITVMESAETTTKSTGIYGIAANQKKEVQKSIADTPDETVDKSVKVGDLVRENISK